MCNCFCKCDEDNCSCAQNVHLGPTHSHYFREVTEPIIHRHESGGKFHRDRDNQLAYDRGKERVEVE